VNMYSEIAVLVQVKEYYGNQFVPPDRKNM
jgi:hypothetical protein